MLEIEEIQEIPRFSECPGYHMFLVFWNFWIALIIKCPGFWDFLDFLNLLVAAQCSRRSRSPEAATNSVATSTSLGIYRKSRK